MKSLILMLMTLCLATSLSAQDVADQVAPEAQGAGVMTGSAQVIAAQDAKEGESPDRCANLDGGCCQSSCGRGRSRGAACRWNRGGCDGCCSGCAGSG